MNLEQLIENIVLDKRSQELIQEIRDSRHGPYDRRNFGWNHGGCVAFAEALITVVDGADLWALGQKGPGYWSMLHTFVKYKGRFYDSSGRIFLNEIRYNYFMGGYGDAKKCGRVVDWVHDKVPLIYPNPARVGRIVPSDCKLITLVEWEEVTSYMGVQTYRNVRHISGLTEIIREAASKLPSGHRRNQQRLMA